MDSRLNILLALRQASVKNETGKCQLTGDFWGLVKKHALSAAADPEEYGKDFNRRLNNVYRKYSPEQLAEIAQARLKIFLTCRSIPASSSSKKGTKSRDGKAISTMM